MIDWSILTGGFDNSYGLLLFSELVANNSQWLPATPAAALPTGAVAHATKDAEGRLKVLLVAKDLEESAATATVTIAFEGTHKKTAQIVRLSAPGPKAKKDIKLAGQTFDGTTDGTPRGHRTVEAVTGKVQGGKTVFEVKLPPLSAAMLVVG